MKGQKPRYYSGINQSNWMDEDSISHWAAWYCVNIKDEDDVRELIISQFACWKYLKERKTTIPVSSRMKQRAAEFDKFLTNAKQEALEEAVNGYFLQEKKRRRPTLVDSKKYL